MNDSTEKPDFPQSPEAINRVEKIRAHNLRVQARKQANHVRMSSEMGKGHSRLVKQAKLSMGKFQLGYSDPAVLGDMLRRRILALATREALKDPGRVLVKDGKPTCPEGEALLNR